MELLRAGKAPLLVFTGGWVTWELDALPEGEVLARYAKAMGVPSDRVVTTCPVTNTAEEARTVATLLCGRRLGSADRGGPLRVLLVTSAFHMPRARRLFFERAGLAVLPFPVDFQVSAGGGATVMDLPPSASALRQTELAWGEIYGRLFDFVVR